MEAVPTTTEAEEKKRGRTHLIAVPQLPPQEMWNIMQRKQAARPATQRETEAPSGTMMKAEHTGFFHRYGAILAPMFVTIIIALAVIAGHIPALHR